MACVPPDRDWLELGREVLSLEIEGLTLVRAALDDSFTRAVELLAGCEGRVVATGLGKSGLVARKIAATLSSTGAPAFYLHPVEGAHGDLGMIRGQDVILAVSNSGETDELNAILPSLRSLGAGLVAITGNPDSTLGRLADVVVCCRVPREACPLDLAPTASTTAALAVGDALAVCLMQWHAFDEKDFRRVHPGGALGQRLKRRASEFMHPADAPDFPVVKDDATLGQALEACNRGGLGAVLLVDEQRRLQGIITDGDVRRLACKGALNPAEPAAAVMIRSPRHALAEQPAAELLDLMEAKAITVLPVVDERRRVLGAIHLHDLLGKGMVRFAG
jgi:arabinose-5-phosphate isomerase